MNAETAFHFPIQSPHCALTSNLEVISGVRPESLLSTTLVVEQYISKQVPLLKKRMWYLVTSGQELWVPTPTFDGGSQVRVTDGTFGFRLAARFSTWFGTRTVGGIYESTVYNFCYNPNYIVHMYLWKLINRYPLLSKPTLLIINCKHIDTVVPALNTPTWLEFEVEKYVVSP